ncbi:MAG: type I-E CRISPR-associated protein Cse1/CasA [Acidobacteriota bacterium]|nr:type I-E CRISPR-associated protein Cse1/CasA [Acidobacteriota bacterium]
MLVTRSTHLDRTIFATNLRPLATLNLINDPWIPVHCLSGRRVIRPDQIAEPDVLRPDWPRPDLNLACLELLVGLMYLAHPPRGSDDRANPPEASVLRAALEPLAPAFELLGDGPRFLQDLEPLEGNGIPIERLFIDSAGDSTSRKNQDLMIRRDRYDPLPLPLAAMALYALQAFAPSGGAGNRTSLRGGGPMVCLVKPGDGGLWPLVWANVPHGEPLTVSEFDALPWMRPTKVSRPVGGQTPETFPESESPTRPDPEVFFGQPRRLRLVAREGLATEFIQRPYGASYPTSKWRHPLTPYYVKGTDFLPSHPKPGSFGYRHWRGVVLRSDGRRRPLALEQYLRDVEHGSCTVLVGGWAMDNMKPLDFVWSEQPAFRFLDEESEDQAAGAVEAAEQLGFALARLVSVGVGEDDTRSGAGLRARETLFENTQTAFEETLGRMSAVSQFVPELWLTQLRHAAITIFDAEVTPGLTDLSEGRRADAISARRQLLAAFAGRSAAGKKIFDALGLQPTSARRNGGRAA